MTNPVTDTTAIAATMPSPIATPLRVPPSFAAPAEVRRPDPVPTEEDPGRAEGGISPEVALDGIG